MRIRKHESSRQIVTCDVIVRRSLLVYVFKKCESLLDVELRILEQQLPLLLYYQLCAQNLVP